MMNEQFMLALGADIAALPLESRWMLRGIQLGMKLSTEIEQSKREELIRCGIFPGDASPDPCQNAGNHGPN